VNGTMSRRETEKVTWGEDLIEVKRVSRRVRDDKTRDKILMA